MGAFFATCPSGTELALRDELKELEHERDLPGPHRIRADRGGVRFEGSLLDAAATCLRARIAVRVLESIARLPAPDGDALYQGACAIEWERWLTPRHTLAVSAVSRRSALTHTGFIAQRTKDAIVDRLREREGARPDVARKDPDLAIFVHLKKDEAAIFLDVSGEALHRRGWRIEGGEAPLKETLAAAVLRLAGWDRARPLIDPACGSGTLVIEADLWARNVAPNLGRRLGAERWADWSLERELAELREALRRRERAEGPSVLGSDIDRTAIKSAEANARRAGAEVSFRTAAFAELGGLPARAHVVSNFPYGLRLDEGRIWDELRAAMPALEGARLSLLLANPPPPGLLPAPISSHTLWNGALECRLLTFEL